MTGTHDKFLVLLSIVIAMVASFTALNLARRVRASRGWVRRGWLTAAATAMGGGIWSMHFVAMLAFSMPGMTTSFDLALTVISLVIALIFTGLGFAVMNWQTISRGRVASAGLLMGSGVVAMHYIGMAAMRMSATLSYGRLWLVISVLIAIGAATAAVWLAARDRKLSHRLGAAGAMGVAIAGMHYAGMRAAIFTSHLSTDLAGGTASVSQTYLAVVIGALTLLILLMALGAERIERRFEGFARREARIALRLRVADVLREQGTAEALHEVASLVGVYFGVTRSGYGQLDQQNDVFDYDICWTDGSVPPLLGRLPAASFGTKIVAALRAGETVAVDDLLASTLADDGGTRDTARGLDTRAILVVPFVRDGQLSTIVYLNDRTPRQWQREDVRFMEEIAERTRLVIERAAVEEQLRDLNATLEARVEARTRELRATQEALLQSQKMEAIGQLVSGLAHDFNNVLGAIVGAFELLRSRAKDAEQVRHLAESGMQAADRGARLTAQLLAFSRSQRIQLQPLHAGAVIGGMRNLLARTLGPMVRLSIELDATPVPVLADATQLEMMVLNLAINARDAMPDGGELSVTTALRTIVGDPEIADGDYLEIAVRDTGIGMDETTLRRAAEPFFTTKPVGKGTGLGLAQIYGSTRQAGGATRILSAPGAGTTVYVLLPCTAQQPAALAPAAATITCLEGAALRILLVDDDHFVRRMVAGGLVEQGHRVVEASDGPAALALLENDLPDIAVLDFAMPGMNGAELARHICERWPTLPIVFASGFSDTGAIEAACGGTARVVKKPFRIHQLLNAIEETLSGGERPRDRRAVAV